MRPINKRLIIDEDTRPLEPALKEKKKQQSYDLANRCFPVKTRTRRSLRESSNAPSSAIGSVSTCREVGTHRINSTPDAILPLAKHVYTEAQGTACSVRRKCTLGRLTFKA